MKKIKRISIILFAFLLATTVLAFARGDGGHRDYRGQEINQNRDYRNYSNQQFDRRGDRQQNNADRFVRPSQRGHDNRYDRYHYWDGRRYRHHQEFFFWGHQPPQRRHPHYRDYDSRERRY